MGVGGADDDNWERVPEFSRTLALEPSWASLEQVSRRLPQYIYIYKGREERERERDIER